MADGDKNPNSNPNLDLDPVLKLSPTAKSGSNDDKLRNLLELGFVKTVALKLDEVIQNCKLALTDLDDRALDALKEYPPDAALAVLDKFSNTNLEHVSNKSAFLCGLLKTVRQKSCMSTMAITSANSNHSHSSGKNTDTTICLRGPDDAKIKEILDRTGYKLDISTGQRKFTGPPPGWKGAAPVVGCEVFCGRIPKDMFEDELIPLFEKCGILWDLRLMMDPINGTNRGYAFVTYTTRLEAQRAVKELDNYEIRSGKNLKVNISVPNLRLFVGNIPKSKAKEDIFDEFGKLTSGLVDVIIYSSPDDKKKNRGFCFLEYESHKDASLAKRRLSTGRIKVWNCDIIVDWADPQEEPDEDTMSRVKVLYVRNLTQDISEEMIRELFETFGKIERVKKIKDYAFVHYFDRDNAIAAMRSLDGKVVGDTKIEVSLAKPPSDKKKKEEMLRARERRMIQMMLVRGGCVPNGAMFPQMLPAAIRGHWPWTWNAGSQWQARWSTIQWPTGISTVATNSNSANSSAPHYWNRVQRWQLASNGYRMNDNSNMNVNPNPNPNSNSNSNANSNWNNSRSSKFSRNMIIPALSVSSDDNSSVFCPKHHVDSQKGD